MRAVILAGGEGTRLRPLTYAMPKPLLPIVNIPFLERQISWLASHGVDEVMLSMGYLPDAFVEHIPEGKFAGVQIRYAVEDQPLGTAGAIRFAAEGLLANGPDVRLVVCNGDVLTDLDLTALLSFHEARGAQATIALTQVEDPSAFGVVPTNEDGSVTAFVEKPPRDQAPTNWINAGTYVMEASVLDRIPAGRNVSIERETFPTLIGHGLYGMPSDAYWLDIGTPEQYLRAHLDLLDCERLPLVIGNGCTLAPDAVVARSVLGQRCVIGAGAVIERSVLFDDVSVAAGVRIQDSIIGPGARIGEHAQLVDVTVVGAGAEVPQASELRGERCSPAGPARVSGIRP